MKESIDYQVNGKVESINFNNTGKPKLLKIKKNRYGYNEVTLSKNNKRKFYLLITLVAEHFLNKPAPDMIPIHLGDVTDDSVENIAYGYRSEMLHLMYKKRHRKIGKPTRNIISYKNKQYKSFSEMAKDYKIKRKNLDKRIQKGWTLQEALDLMYEKYCEKVNRPVEGFVINFHNIITKYVRMKNGKLVEYSDTDHKGV